MDIQQSNDDNLLTDLLELAENPSRGLSIDDLLSIENIRSKFDSLFVQNATEFLTMDAPNQNSPIKLVLQVGNQVALLVINFFRQIEHFENLHVDDRFLLIKYNLCQLFPILKCARYPLVTDPFPFHNNEQRFNSSGSSNEILDQSAYLADSFAQSTERDPVIVSLLTIISLFSEALPLTGTHQPLLKDSLAIFRAQSYYTELLWNYSLDKYGELKTGQKFTQLLGDIIRIQSVTERFRAFLREQFLSMDDHDALSPLLHTILHIS